MTRDDTSPLWPLRRLYIALCSLSTGMILRFRRAASSSRNCPPMTMDSLLARARSSPASRHARDAASPAEPAIPFSAMSPPQFLMKDARASCESLIRYGQSNSLESDSSLSLLCLATSPVTSASSLPDLIASRQVVPMEPVAPRMRTLLISQMVTWNKWRRAM